MRLTTALSAATAAAVTLAVAAPGAGAMVSSGGGGTPYSGTSATRSHRLVSGVGERTGQIGTVRAHTVGFRGCPRVGPCSSPYHVAIDGSGSPLAHQTTATSQQAFQWGDAGIGAGATVLLLGAGGAAAVATRRQRRRVTTS
jgi:hypothetical protein